jgi:hypothetical protein
MLLVLPRRKKGCLELSGRPPGQPKDTTELLKAVLHEAEVMLAEMEQRNFQVLDVAPGGFIWGDLVNCKE